MHKQILTEKQCWSLIADSLSNSQNRDEQEQWLIKELTKLSPDEIIEFYLQTSHFKRNLFTPEMWCAFDLMTNRGFSDDGFEYFLGWIISRGKEVYYDALDNPDNLVNHLIAEDQEQNYELEFYGIPMEAYELKTKKDFGEGYEKCCKVFKENKDKTKEGEKQTTKEPFQLYWSGKPHIQKAICPRLFNKFRK